MIKMSIFHKIDDVLIVDAFKTGGSVWDWKLSR